MEWVVLNFFYHNPFLKLDTARKQCVPRMRAMVVYHYERTVVLPDSGHCFNWKRTWQLYNTYLYFCGIVQVFAEASTTDLTNKIQ